jgi:hypothetical protein
VTNLFARNLCRGAGVGTYTVTVSDGALTFDAVRDDCSRRQAVLATAPWTSG